MIRTSHIAQVSYESYRAYCKTILEYHQPKWGMLSEKMKEHYITLVESLQDKPMSPEEMHNKWLADQKAAGWKRKVEKNDEGEVVRVYPYHPVRKVNPLMVPFEELPVEHQRKNEVFLGAVKIFMGMSAVKEEKPAPEPEEEEKPNLPDEPAPEPEEKPKAKPPKQPKAKAGKAYEGKDAVEAGKELRK